MSSLIDTVSVVADADSKRSVFPVNLFWSNAVLATRALELENGLGWQLWDARTKSVYCPDADTAEHQLKGIFSREYYDMIDSTYIPTQEKDVRTVKGEVTISSTENLELTFADDSVRRFYYRGMEVFHRRMRDPRWRNPCDDGWRFSYFSGGDFSKFGEELNEATLLEILNSYELSEPAKAKKTDVDDISYGYDLRALKNFGFMFGKDCRFLFDGQNPLYLQSWIVRARMSFEKGRFKAESGICAHFEAGFHEPKPITHQPVGMDKTIACIHREGVVYYIFTY